MPKVLQVDFTFNEIKSLTTVEDFAQRSLEIVHLDIAHNPLLNTATWKTNGWSVAAILPYLEVLNGAEVTMEHHVLANKKHGKIDDQRRLALRIFDDAFMSCAVRSFTTLVCV